MSGVRGILNATCDIYRQAAGASDYGNPSGAFTLSTSGVICRWHERSSRETEEPSDIVDAHYTVWFPYGTDVKENDRLLKSSRYFDVVQVVEDVAGESEITRVIVRIAEV